MTHRTIAAISTPIGPGGIGIIRVSGDQALSVLRQLFVRSRQKAGSAPDKQSLREIRSHTAYHGYIVDPSTLSIIDEVLAIYMQGPKSFTREDIVEIHSHSGYIVLERLLNAVLDAGAHMAEAGEFTKRAFLNGRIDLTQAEAVIDLINAPCETAAMIATSQLTGGISKAIDELILSMNRMQAQCEAIIEFGESDELEEASIVTDIQQHIHQALIPNITALIARQKDASIYRDGVLLAIAGAPNVGKSSLLNQLVEKETAIVSEFPGTTRDIVREYYSIKGVPVIFCDTAGIHDATDPVECIGIEKARHHISNADIVLLVVEANRTLNRFEEKLLLDNRNRRTIVVVNKDDIANEGAVRQLKKKLKDVRHIYVSAKMGSGIQALKKLIFRDLVQDRSIGDGSAVTPNLRQRKILEAALNELKRCAGCSVAGNTPEAMALAIDRAIQHLTEIGGKRTNEGLYDEIFSQFCIGK